MTHEPDRKPDAPNDPSDPREEAQLEKALAGSDEILYESLRRDEKRRRWRIGWAFAALILTVVLLSSAAGLLVALNLVIPNQEGSVGDLVDQGWEYYKAGRWRKAESVFQAAASQDSESAEAWNGLGWSRFKSDAFQPAIGAFKRAITLDDGHPGAHNGLGYVYFTLRDYEQAEAHWLKVDEDAPAAWGGLAQLYLLQENYKAAEFWVRKALKGEPENETLLAIRHAAEAGSVDDSLRMQIEPSMARVGWSLLNDGRVRDARRKFRQAVGENPRDVSAQNGLGFILLNRGDIAEAKEKFEICLELQPDAAGPLNGLARCLRVEGKIEEAIDIWERMVGRSRDPNAGTHGLAWAYYELGRFEEALPFLEQLAKNDPHNTELQAAIERAERAIQEKQDAEE